MISLILYARSSVSEYQNSKLELDRVENLAKFNEQFAQYDRKDVTGYEIISLANKVADYNYRYSNHSDARNNEGYTPIKMEITFEPIIFDMRDFPTNLSFNVAMDIVGKRYKNEEKINVRYVKPEDEKTKDVFFQFHILLEKEKKKK